MNSVKISNTFVDIIIWKKEEYHIASLRLIKFTSLPGRLKISNTSTVYPAKKGYQSRAFGISSSRPIKLPAACLIDTNLIKLVFFQHEKKIRHRP